MRLARFALRAGLGLAGGLLGLWLLGVGGLELLYRLGLSGLEPLPVPAQVEPLPERVARAYWIGAFDGVGAPELRPLWPWRVGELLGWGPSGPAVVLRVQAGSQLAAEWREHGPRRRTLRRHLDEVALGVWATRNFSGRRALDWLGGRVYLGRPGGGAVQGFAPAAPAWFRRPLAELSDAQLALLIGLSVDPASYDPCRRPERARARRQVVLDRLLAGGALDRAAWRQASRQPLGARCAAED